MNVEQAKTICPDFDPAKQDDGKVRCQSIVEGNFCTLPLHFRCELVIWREKGNTGRPAVSLSRVGSYDFCPRNYMLRYIAKASSPETSEWKEVGRLFALHRARIEHDLSWTIPAELPGCKPESLTKLRAVLRAYQRNRPVREPIDNEVTFRKSFDDRTDLVGIVDAISRNRIRLYEWKYARSVDDYPIIRVARQAALYFWLIGEECEEVGIYVAEKPQNRLKKDESLEAFEERVHSEIVEGDSFKQRWVRRHEIDVDREIEYFRQAVDRVRRSHATKAFPPDYARCSNCDFSGYCGTHVGSGIGCESVNCSHPKICEKVKI